MKLPLDVLFGMVARAKPSFDTFLAPSWQSSVSGNETAFGSPMQNGRQGPRSEGDRSVRWYVT
ncbi:MAG: hypothetical protein A2Y14_03645 [Verrucomicrobia bacterium GWF2_51_19]|nr:MAG: hypothetical protein A2Y14_03645 [Verrucomicrobia bacterium GWF2_51_19]